MTQTPITLYSGNILKHDIDPNANLASCLIHKLTHWNPENDQKACNSGHKASFFDPSLILPPNTTKWSEDPDCDLEITAKLFLPVDITPEDARKHLTSIINLYKTQLHHTRPITYFILAFDGVDFADENECLEQHLQKEKLFSIWKAITEAPTTGAKDINTQYGVSEFSTTRLQQLLDQIENHNNSSDKTLIPRPSLDHINANDCCALPPGLLSISKSTGIKLLAHHDPQILISNDELNQVVNSFKQRLGNVDDLSSSRPQWNWILKLTSVLKHRQVLVASEYLMNLNI